MKHKKSLAALALCALLTSTLTGCGSAEGQSGDLTDVDPLAAAQANMAAVTSMEAQIVMVMDLEITGQTVESVTTMDMTCFVDPLQLKADISMDMGELGSTDMTIYAETDGDGRCTMYLNDGSGWQSQSVDAEELDQFDARSSMALYLDSSAGFTQTGTEQINGADAYRYSGVISGDSLKEIMLSSGALDSLSSLGITSGQLEDMISGLGDISVTLWIDTESLCPIKYDMDMTTVMNALISNAAESAGMQDLDMSIPKMTLSMTCSNFNSAAAFTIPDEAKGA